MSEIVVSHEGQITLPAELLRKGNVRPSDRFNVELVNGSFVLTPARDSQVRASVMSYAGIAKGLWGEGAEQIDASVNDLHDEWQR